VGRQLVDQTAHAQLDQIEDLAGQIEDQIDQTADLADSNTDQMANFVADR